jgi:hypothetical protein
MAEFSEYKLESASTGTVLRMGYISAMWDNFMKSPQCLRRRIQRTNYMKTLQLNY